MFSIPYINFLHCFTVKKCPQIYIPNKISICLPWSKWLETPSIIYVQFKIVYIFLKKFFFSVRGHISVIRTCGVEEKYLLSDTAKANPLDEYNTVLQEYATEVYNCREEGCNGSPNLKISFLALLTVLAALIHWKLYYYL